MDVKNEPFSEEEQRRMWVDEFRHILKGTTRFEPYRFEWDNLLILFSWSHGVGYHVDNFFHLGKKENQCDQLTFERRHECVQAFVNSLNGKRSWLQFTLSWVVWFFYLAGLLLIGISKNGESKRRQSDL